MLDVVEKIRALDREVKYMLNKAKIVKPKPKPDPAKKEKKKAAADNGTVIGGEDAVESAPKTEAEAKPEQEYAFPSDEDLAKEAAGQDGDASPTKDSDAEGAHLKW